MIEFIGSYRIVEKLGEGGMGEVYRARDTKLNRDVAVKVLPDAFTADPDRLARFKREAQVLASLNHPHIAHIYGLEGQAGQAGESACLVMELVEGEDLAQRLTRGAIPLDEALPIAKQIADALEAAHEQGIVHRDLKPANIKVRPDGMVKVLDFGLAKALDTQAGAGVQGAGVPGAAQLTNSPTLTSPVFSQVGVILGTAAYMAPEQARGRAVDKRADIWAFGVVLYEMLTGERLFQGEDLTETLASVVKEQPDISKAPRQVQRLLRKCLEKDPKKRLRDLGDAWDLLDAGLSPLADAATKPRVSAWIPWGAAAAFAIGFATLAFLHFRAQSPASGPSRHLFVQMSERGASFFALSPDGRSVVMTTGLSAPLGIRSLDTGELRALAGTENARAPFWSPDSRTVGFFASQERKLKIVPVSGGLPQTLCDDVSGRGSGTWNRDGTILVSETTLLRTTASGGGCTELIKADANVTRSMPVFLPDGDHFLYLVGSTDEKLSGLYVGSLKDPSGKRLLADRSSGLFVPDAPGATEGHLLFSRAQTLMAQRFDSRSLTLSGDPALVANHVSWLNNSGLLAASAANDGTLMFLSNNRPDRQVVWYDRTGTRGEVVIRPNGDAGYAGALSPDGKRLAFRRTDAQGRTSLWITDLERKQELAMTNAPFVPGPAVWSPDSQRLAFGGTSARERGIWVKDVNGGMEMVLRDDTGSMAVGDWSHDGRWLAYTAVDARTAADIWMLPMTAAADARKPVALLKTPASEAQPQISPDGKWVAYTSDALAGQYAVVLQAFPGGAPLSQTKWQVSVRATAEQPRWRADSRELYYLEPGDPGERRVMAVPIASGPSPVGSPVPLFQFRVVTTNPGQSVFTFAPAPDGQRFLVDEFVVEAPPTLEVILNWAGAH